MPTNRHSILVINPNSNPVVTKAIDEAARPFRFADGPEIDCISLESGPLGIETQADVDDVAIPLRNLVKEETSRSAFVIACYSEPALDACRDATNRPVLGLGQCGMLAAMARGDRPGIVTTRQAAIKRHMRAIRRYGFEYRLAGERAIDMTVAETASGEHTLAKMIAVGKELIDIDGADVVIMGCGGMAAYRIPLEEALGVPVVDPVQAAIGMAVNAVVVEAVIPATS
jgi:Asp/Glu/hydantoin racemase